MAHEKGTAKNPVLLVHGFLDRLSVFQRMTVYLEQQGWDVHRLNLLPNDGRKSLPDLAQQVAHYAETNFATQQAFDLIGFSMGGLVTRYYLQRLQGCDRVTRYISISAPNNGTLTAHSLGLPGIKNMRPNSDFLEDLNSDIHDTLATVQVTWFWTPFDLMILPAASSYLPIGTEVKLPVLLHPWMLTDPRVLAAIAQALSQPIPING